METNKILLLAVTGIIATLLLLLVIRQLTRKLHPTDEGDAPTPVSYGIWASALVIAGGIILSTALSALGDAVDALYRLNGNNAGFKSVEYAASYTAISVLWLMVWHFIAAYIQPFLLGNRKIKIEAQRNNYTYFLLRGVILIVLVLLVQPLLSLIFHNLVPTVEIPIYH